MAKGQSKIAEELKNRPKVIHHDYNSVGVASKTTSESIIDSIQRSIKKHPTAWKEIIKDAKNSHKLQKDQRLEGIEYFIICCVNGSALIPDGQDRSFKEIASKSGILLTEAEVKEKYISGMLKLQMQYNAIAEDDSMTFDLMFD